MSRVILMLLVPAVVVACAGKDDDERGEAEPLPPATIIQPTDASLLPPDDAAAGVTQLPAFDPRSGFHLDDVPTARPAGRLPPREKKVAQIILRSTPTGAMAMVDGVRLGPTPVLWEGLLDGQPHDFTFGLAGHALARYRFVPVTGGIVHATLVKITDDKDAGTPEFPAPPPPAQQRPSSAPPPAPRRPPAPLMPTVDAPLPPMPPPVDAGSAPVGPAF